MIETEIIAQYFTTQPNHEHIQLGSGDDAALCTIPDGMQLVTSIDTSVAGVHFPADTAPADIGYKSLAVSMSDMAAMGADPFTALLSLSLPKAEDAWISAFCNGFFTCAEQFNVTLIGGDITRGPTCITTVANGLVPKGKALTRDGAQPGNGVFVTGQFGDAGLALQLIRRHAKEIPEALLLRLNRPMARVAEGIAIRDVATAAIDVSDGLLADLQKLLKASGVGANIDASKVPLSQTLQDNAQAAINIAMNAGDDYELCFTAPLKAELPSNCVCIGEVHTKPTLNIHNTPANFKQAGFRHF